MDRRTLLATTAALFVTGAAGATTIRGKLPWRPDAGEPPIPVAPTGLTFFTPEEASAVGALADRLIPPDDTTPGAVGTGCVTFIDRQLAGPYGRSEGLYVSPPFLDALPTQGDQSPLTPAARYRQGLTALDAHVRGAFLNKRVADLSDAERDQLLTDMQKGTLQLAGANARAFFASLLKNTKEGFFADPVYGGNKDMAAWKMIGFPGARYDYRDYIARHNETFPLPPVGITGRPEWAVSR